MASNNSVTAEQFNAFVEALVKNLNSSHDYMYKRFDRIEARLAGIDGKIERLEKASSSVEANVAAVKRDTSLLPPIFEMLEQDGVEIATLRTKVDKMQN